MAAGGADGRVGDEPPVHTERLVLTPLRRSDADDMFAVLNHVDLHTYIGGEPLSLDDLRSRYARLESGAGRHGEVWVNWIARRRTDGAAVGTVQATIVGEPDRRAEVAWVIGVAWQRQGYAREAAGALVRWLRSEGIERIEAHIHLDHEASMAVARGVGMHPTSVRHDGETLWLSLRSADENSGSWA